MERRRLPQTMAARSPLLKIEYLPPERLKTGGRKIRRQSRTFIKTLVGSVSSFGMLQAIVIDQADNVIIGHGLLGAAKEIGLKTVPVIRADHLSETQLRGFALAHNKIGEGGEWNFDEDGLPAELKELLETPLDFSFDATGFEHAEADLIVYRKGKKDEASEIRTLANEGPVITRRDDLWVLGKHRVLCADALEPTSYERVLEGNTAQGVFSDPPYGVAMEGHVSGRGKTKHRPFIMGGDEMKEDQLAAFYVQYFRNTVKYSDPGAIIYAAIDWRHAALMQAAAAEAQLELINVAVWVKDNPGLGSYYRSGHELFLVLRNGPQPHTNNIQLGRFGRNRSNVWTCPSANDFGRGGGEGDLLAKHPTPKPVPLVAGALLDSTRRGDHVLDPFLGSGTTVIAAEETGRVAHGIELDPIYIDVAVQRWQAFTGKAAVESDTGLTFEELRQRRMGESHAA